ncbi:MAG: hypothetical protein AAFV88_03110 [Planctomycetota bacterium]
MPQWTASPLRVVVDGVDVSASMTRVHCRLDDRNAGKVRWILDWYVSHQNRIRLGQTVRVSWDGPLAADSMGNSTDRSGQLQLRNRSILNVQGRYSFQPNDPRQRSQPTAWHLIRPNALVSCLDADRPWGNESPPTEPATRFPRWSAIAGQDAIAFDPIAQTQERPPLWSGPRSSASIAGRAVFRGGGGRSSNEGVYSLKLDQIDFSAGMTAMWVVRQTEGSFRPLNAVTFVDAAGRSKTLHPNYVADGVHTDGSIVLITMNDDGNGQRSWRLNGQPLTEETSGSTERWQSISLLAKHNGRDATADDLACFGLWNATLSLSEMERAEAWALAAFRLNSFRQIFVSNAGDNANDGLTPNTPKKTLSAASRLIPRCRDNARHPVTACVDFRFARGSTFNGTFYLPSGSDVTSGGVSWRSPIHLSSYGSGPRPKLRSLSQRGRTAFVIVSSLDLVDRERIPPSAPGHSPEHFGGLSARQNRGISLGDRYARVAVVDCDIRHHSEAIVLDGQSMDAASEIVFSRNRIHGTSKYQGIKGLTGRSSGIFIRYARLRCVLSENVWDMNGHIDTRRYPSLTESPATIYSHHQYLSSAREACRVDSIGEFFCSSSNNATMMRSAGGRVWLNAYVDNTIDGYCGDGEKGQVDFGAPASVWRTIHWGGQRPTNSIRSGGGALTAINQGFHLKIGSDHQLSECIFDKSDALESVAAKSLHVIDEFSSHGIGRATIKQTLIYKSPRTGFAVYSNPKAIPNQIRMQNVVLSAKSGQLPMKPEDAAKVSIDNLVLESRHRSTFQAHSGIRFVPSVRIGERRTPGDFESQLQGRAGLKDEHFRDRLGQLTFGVNDSIIAMLDWARQGYRVR